MGKNLVENNDQTKLCNHLHPCPYHFFLSFLRGFSQLPLLFFQHNTCVQLGLCMCRSVHLGFCSPSQLSTRLTCMYALTLSIIVNPFLKSLKLNPFHTFPVVSDLFFHIALISIQHNIFLVINFVFWLLFPGKDMLWEVRIGPLFVPCCLNTHDKSRNYFSNN